MKLFALIFNVISLFLIKGFIKAVSGNVTVIQKTILEKVLEKKFITFQHKNFRDTFVSY